MAPRHGAITRTDRPGWPQELRAAVMLHVPCTFVNQFIKNVVYLYVITSKNKKRTEIAWPGSLEAASRSLVSPCRDFCIPGRELGPRQAAQGSASDLIDARGRMTRGVSALPHPMGVSESRYPTSPVHAGHCDTERWPMSPAKCGAPGEATWRTGWGPRPCNLSCAAE